MSRFLERAEIWKSVFGFVYLLELSMSILQPLLELPHVVSRGQGLWASTAGINHRLPYRLTHLCCRRLAILLSPNVVVYDLRFGLGDAKKISGQFLLPHKIQWAS